MMFEFYFKCAPYLYVSLSFFTMLTQYVYNTVDFFRKKHWGWGHGISKGKVSGKYEELHSLPTPPGNDPEPRASKPTLLTIKPPGHVLYMKLKILYT